MSNETKPTLIPIPGESPLRLEFGGLVASGEQELASLCLAVMKSEEVLFAALWEVVRCCPDGRCDGKTPCVRCEIARAALNRARERNHPAPRARPIELDAVIIATCPRCGEPHTLRFAPLQRPAGPYSLWALCPTLNEPILQMESRLNTLTALRLLLGLGGAS